MKQVRSSSSMRDEGIGSKGIGFDVCGGGEARRGRVHGPKGGQGAENMHCRLG